MQFCAGEVLVHFRQIAASKIAEAIVVVGRPSGLGFWTRQPDRELPVSWQASRRRFIVVDQKNTPRHRRSSAKLKHQRRQTQPPLSSSPEYGFRPYNSCLK